ncbi:sphingosine hydroxylase [Sparassis latifolia]|uniref:Sphingolipid C4-hydroxylase SUR2 n=1 Tax=Sparassis crispa TaxID=139825 RepID=A0A401GWE0_9APHY|nr:Sphingolipid C4-hydroxylase SUR2 [Sparassis crispa]GBE86520.1 Sphingolipid C4-hydroxylase SUR2 [Sparassis crispa]
MNASDAAAVFSSVQLRYLSTTAPLYYTPRPAIFSWLPDHYLSLAAPVVVYWISSLFFHCLDISGWKYLEKYRIHESAEVKAKNLVTRTQVILAVILQHIIQTAMGYFWMEEKASGAGVDHLGAMANLASSLLHALQWVFGETTGGRILETQGAVSIYTLYWWTIPAVRFLFAMFIIDTWQYFLHRTMHMNTFLYKRFHSVHHRLYVPYAFGALYNHPLEGFLLDTLGAVFAESLAGMSTREAILLFCVSTLKTVDDHCGYSLPWDVLQFFSSNTADYHDIHHQIIGIKSNFAQPFFIHWDVLLGTRMTRKDMELRRQKQKKAQ